MEVRGPVGGEEIPPLFPRKPSIHLVQLTKETQRRYERMDEYVTDSIKRAERESQGEILPYGRMQEKGGGLPPFASLPLCTRVAPDIVLIKHTLVDKV